MTAGPPPCRRTAGRARVPLRRRARPRLVRHPAGAEDACGPAEVPRPGDRGDLGHRRRRRSGVHGHRRAVAVPGRAAARPAPCRRSGNSCPSATGGGSRSFTRARAGMAADCPRKSGKSQGRYPTPPVQTGHNTYDNLSLFCSICVVLATYYEISDWLTLHPAGMLTKPASKTAGCSAVSTTRLSSTSGAGPSC